MATHEFQHEMGVELQDKITGFKGRVVHRVQFITGCDQYGLQPEGLDEKGEPKKAHQFDENRLKVLDATPIEIYEQAREKNKARVAGSTPGGPQQFVGK